MGFGPGESPLRHTGPLLPAAASLMLWRREAFGGHRAASPLVPGQRWDPTRKAGGKKHPGQRRRDVSLLSYRHPVPVRAHRRVEGDTAEMQAVDGWRGAEATPPSDQEASGVPR